MFFQAVLSFITCVAIFLIFRTAILGFQRWERRSGTRIESGEEVLREMDKISLTILTDKNIPGGPKANQKTRSHGRMVLTDRRLIFASNHGRLLELNAESPGEIRPVGPRRLVLLGPHPNGRAQMRLEIVVDDEQGWTDAVREVLGLGA